MVHLLQKQIPALSFIQPCSNPIFKIKKQPSRKAARLSSCINLIAGRLLSSRAYFLFRLTIAIKGLQLIKSPTIFQYITSFFISLYSKIRKPNSAFLLSAIIMRIEESPRFERRLKKMRKPTH